MNFLECPRKVLLTTTTLKSAQEKVLKNATPILKNAILIFPTPFLFENLKKLSLEKKMSDSDSTSEEELFETPQLVLETFKSSRLQKNPRLEHFKNIIRQNQGKNKIPLPDLEFYQEQILAQIPREEITRKKVREFVKNQGWKKVRGNDHEIFNHITGHDGNDYEHLEDFLIDDFKYFSLAYNDLRLNRKKFLNFHQVLFALLKKNGFNPNEDDFKLLVLPSRRAEQEKIIQEVFKRNNWKENGS